MIYTIYITQAALKRLEALPLKLRASIEQRVFALENNPRPRGALKLKGPKYQGWRIRAGKYRVIYTIDDSAHAVDVLVIDLRDQAYHARD